MIYNLILTNHNKFNISSWIYNSKTVWWSDRGHNRASNRHCSWHITSFDVPLMLFSKVTIIFRVINHPVLTDIFDWLDNIGRITVSARAVVIWVCLTGLFPLVFDITHTILHIRYYTFDTILLFLSFYQTGFVYFIVCIIHQVKRCHG